LTVDGNKSPKEGFEECQHTLWKTTEIIIDPSSHKDGQKVSIKKDKNVGESFSLLRSIAGFLNKSKETSYHVEIEPIFNPDSFWDFAKENRGTITTIRFEFTAPNMFGYTDDIENKMQNFRDYEKAQKIKIELNSSDGLNPETERIKQSVHYAQRGTGSIYAKTE